MVRCRQRGWFPDRLPPNYLPGQLSETCITRRFGPDFTPTGGRRVATTAHPIATAPVADLLQAQPFGATSTRPGEWPMSPSSRTSWLAQPAFSFVDGLVILAELQLGAAVGCLQHDHFGPDVVEADDRIYPVAFTICDCPSCSSPSSRNCAVTASRSSTMTPTRSNRRTGNTAPSFRSCLVRTPREVLASDWARHAVRPPPAAGG